jgi:hypothetical protein
MVRRMVRREATRESGEQAHWSVRGAVGTVCMRRYRGVELQVNGLYLRYPLASPFGLSLDFSCWVGSVR